MFSSKERDCRVSFQDKLESRGNTFWDNYYYLLDLNQEELSGELSAQNFQFLSLVKKWTTPCPGKAIISKKSFWKICTAKFQQAGHFESFPKSSSSQCLQSQQKFTFRFESVSDFRYMYIYALSHPSPKIKI